MIDRDELDERISTFLQDYAILKEEVRRADSRLYEQWKAGGFLVDSDIMSMYPNLEEVARTISEDDDERECDTCGEVYSADTDHACAEE